MILHVRFGGILTTTTPLASALICSAAKFERRTPDGVSITNRHYEGDWDADVTTEEAENVAQWVVRLWPESWIEGDDAE